MNCGRFVISKWASKTGDLLQDLKYWISANLLHISLKNSPYNLFNQFEYYIIYLVYFWVGENHWVRPSQKDLPTTQVKPMNISRLLKKRRHFDFRRRHFNGFLFSVEKRRKVFSFLLFLIDVVFENCERWVLISVKACLKHLLMHRHRLCC